jgi:hypothetical protein
MDKVQVNKSLREEHLYNHIDKCLKRSEQLEHLYDNAEILPKIIYIEVRYLGCFKKKMRSSRYNNSRFWKFIGKVN